MKIIEAMKKVKVNTNKVADLGQKISQHCALLDDEKGEYGDEQQAKVEGWVQTCHDLIREIELMRVAVQRTNMVTEVTIELGGIKVTKPITAWIHRRRDLSDMERRVWAGLTDRNLRPLGKMIGQDESTAYMAQVRRFFNPEERDEKVALFRDEPLEIDSALEVINATTDIIQ